ncbi:MAG: NUDIX hydrolase [Parcubacteria group bacterium Greene0714_21]|nr:MAG: NUDIX hydrolase [Parcubacteria group bacterium Greene0416_39]TSC98513.1 MAG: NUDIX hydrolase [Parcubacteria group bacterium Greene1014_47]TSD04275.1 MAG: NUDIX hydrolase [Parcubacteria group bacterium Greene0714_21]
MPHIHESIDWTVVAYVVYQNKVLFVFHKELQKWLPLGGHIELSEDPDQALVREVEEESGIQELEVLATKPDIKVDAVERKFLYTPAYVDIHTINEKHRHIGLVYFLRAKTNVIRLAEQEHTEIRWLTEEELDNPEFRLEHSIKFYAKEALQRAAQ